MDLIGNNDGVLDTYVKCNCRCGACKKTYTRFIYRRKLFGIPREARLGDGFLNIMCQDCYERAAKKVNEHLRLQGRKPLDLKDRYIENEK